VWAATVQSGERGYLVEVLAVVHHVNGDQCALGLRGGLEVQGAHVRCEGLRRLRRISGDEDCPGGGNDVHLARARMGHELGLEAEDGMQGGQFNQDRPVSGRSDPGQLDRSCLSLVLLRGHG